MFNIKYTEVLTVLFLSSAFVLSADSYSYTTRGDFGTGWVDDTTHTTVPPALGYSWTNAIMDFSPQNGGVNMSLPLSLTNSTFTDNTQQGVFQITQNVTLTNHSAWINSSAFQEINQNSTFQLLSHSSFTNESISALTNAFILNNGTATDHTTVINNNSNSTIELRGALDPTSTQPPSFINNYGTFANSNLIKADGIFSASPSINNYAGGTFNNNGTIQDNTASGKPNLVLTNALGATFNNSNTGTVSLKTTFNNFGNFNSIGTFNGNFQNGGTFRMADGSGTPGLASNFGNFSNSTSVAGSSIPGTIALIIAGTGSAGFNPDHTPIAPQYSVLREIGNLNLNGSNLMANLHGFVPVSGDVFDIIDYTGTLTGMFATTDLPLLPLGLTWTVAYGDGYPMKNEYNDGNLYNSIFLVVGGTQVQVPEPSTYLLLGASLGCVLISRARRLKSV